MIVGSLALILVAAAALVAGLVWDSNPLLIGSIAVSVVAAVVLFLSARRPAATGRDAVRHHRGGSGDEPAEEHRVREDRESLSRLSRAATRAGDSRTGATRTASRGHESDGEGLSRHAASEPVESRAHQAPPAGEAAADYDRGNDRGNDAGLGDDDPADEPSAQYTSALDAARVARLDSDVLVIDGRPRYHLPGCVHLLGRESEPIPVGEAVELGFTPCSLCEPDTTLLAGAADR